VRGVRLAVDVQAMPASGTAFAGAAKYAVVVSGPNAEDFRLHPVDDVLQPWHDLLERHTNDPRNGRCADCKVAHCERWWWARERLAEEGALPGAFAKPEDTSEPRGTRGSK
jgi:hypothetical protein